MAAFVAINRLGNHFLTTCRTLHRSTPYYYQVSRKSRQQYKGGRRKGEEGRREEE